MIHGIDVSNWQGAFNWASQKIAFALAKATEGTAYRDPQFARNWREMKARGLVRGAYHFAHPDNSVAGEADHFVSVVRAQGLHDGDLLALDLEVADGRTPGQIAAFARGWCERVQTATGIRPIVYTFISFARNGSCSGLGGYPLWIAAPSYAAGKPPMPLGPWKTWAIHQHTDNPIDKNVSQLSAAQLRALGQGGDDVAAKDVWTENIPAGPDFKKVWPAGTHLRYQTQQGDAQLKELAALRATQNELVKALGNLAGLDADGLVARIDAAVRKALEESTVDVVVHDADPTT